MPDIIQVVRPAVPTARMTGASGAGQRGFIAPDGTRVVVELSRCDTTKSGLDSSHVAIGVTAWEVNATGKKIGNPIAGWTHSAPIDVVASGVATLASIIQECEDAATNKVLARKTVLAQMAALNLAPEPSVAAADPIVLAPRHLVETLPATPSSIS